MKTITMNPMNLMNLFLGSRYIKKIFSFLSLISIAEKVHPCSSGRFLTVLGSFLSININKLVVWMNQMYMDEPLANFKRESVSDEISIAIEMNLLFGQRFIKVHRVH